MFETLFSLGNLLALAFWIPIILLPTLPITRRIYGSPLVIVPFAVFYVIGLLGAVATPGAPPLDFGSLGAIQALLGSAAGATTGWMHFLAFDLFVGRWIYLDSIERKITPWLVSPCLFFVFMFGPVGYLLYMLVRYTASRSRRAK